MRGGTLRSPVAAIATAVGIIFLIVPIAVVILFSFHKTAALSLPFTGFSLRWYRAMFHDAAFRDAIKTSLVLSAIVAGIAVVLGTATAYGLSRASPRLRPPVSALVFVPLAVPLLFVGLSLFSFFKRIGIDLSWTTLVIGHLVYVLPYFMLIVLVALGRLDPALEEAAADLGASPARLFFKVTLPQVWPVIAAATALVFALSFDEFPITYWVAGQQTTVPLFIFALLRRAVDPTLNAVSTLLMVVTLLLFATAFVVIARADRRRTRQTAQETNA